MIPFYERPCADKGLTSYRYRGQYGWVMIGAKGTDDALAQASRSIESKPELDRLEVWNGQSYEKASAQ